MLATRGAGDRLRVLERERDRDLDCDRSPCVPLTLRNLLGAGGASSLSRPLPSLGVADPEAVCGKVWPWEGEK